MFKRLLNICCSVILLFTLALPVNVQAQANLNANRDIELEKRIVNFNELEKDNNFQKLTKEEQIKLKNTLQDEQQMNYIMKEFLEYMKTKKDYSSNFNSTSLGYEEYVVELNKDIQFKSTTNTEDITMSSMSLRSKNIEGHSVSGSESVEMLGVKIVEISGTIVYDYEEGGDVSKPTDANFYVSRNFVPGVTIEVALPMKYRKNNKAVGSATFTFGFGLDGFDIEYETDRLTIYGDNKGKGTHKIEYHV